MVEVGEGFVYSELKREKAWSRIHLIPLLQAEEDRDQVRRFWADQERERELLGTKTRPYHSDRYVLSTTVTRHLFLRVRTVGGNSMVYVD